MTMSPARLLVVGWYASVAGAIGVRVWNAVFGPLFYGYDAWGHISYVFFLDMYRAIPYADQGWSYFHPPLHYLFGWALMQLGNPKALVVGIRVSVMVEPGRTDAGTPFFAARARARVRLIRNELTVQGGHAAARTREEALGKAMARLRKKVYLTLTW